MTQYEIFNKENSQLNIVVEDMASLTQEEYLLARKQGLGATDNSVYLEHMLKFNKTRRTVVQDKCTFIVTEEDKQIAALPSVRKGRDLEPLILTKFAELHQCDIPLKPISMYSIGKYPHLTVNFDGVVKLNERWIPVECKYVTTAGSKNYDISKAIMTEFETTKLYKEPYGTAKDNFNYRVSMAEQCGIPVYYYTQIQQQLLALEAPYGYLAALFEKDWKLRIFKVPYDNRTVNNIIIESNSVWNEILRARKTY